MGQKPLAASPGRVLDEALAVGRDASTFPAADEDYFRDMDGGVPLTPEEIKGRNSWIVWTAGNDRFWDGIGVTAYRRARFPEDAVVASQPEDQPRSTAGSISAWSTSRASSRPTGPDPKRHGLWLDQRSPDCPPDPFENEQKYPGVAIGARGKTIETRLLLRLCHGRRRAPAVSEPRLRRAGREGVGCESLLHRPEYYNSNTLVRPYRVGMSCGFCHVGPNPTKPPADPENPKWENLSSNVGAQYFWVDRIFDWNADPSTSSSSCFTPRARARSTPR